VGEPQPQHRDGAKEHMESGVDNKIRFTKAGVDGYIEKGKSESNIWISSL
jgi:hypothetical protein